MSTTTTPTYGTVRHYRSVLAEYNGTDRSLALLGILRGCIDHDDLDAARNACAAFDQLIAEAVSGS